MIPHSLKINKLLIKSSYRPIKKMRGSLRSEGEGAAPGSDREPFDPESIFQAAESAEVNFGNRHSAHRDSI
jgi:hypothetical protein